MHTTGRNLFLENKTQNLWAPPSPSSLGSSGYFSSLNNMSMKILELHLLKVKSKYIFIIGVLKFQAPLADIFFLDLEWACEIDPALVRKETLSVSVEVFRIMTLEGTVLGTFLFLLCLPVKSENKKRSKKPLLKSTHNPRVLQTEINVLLVLQDKPKKQIIHPPYEWRFLFYNTFYCHQKIQ